MPPVILPTINLQGDIFDRHRRRVESAWNRTGHEGPSLGNEDEVCVGQIWVRPRPHVGNHVSEMGDEINDEHREFLIQIRTLLCLPTNSSVLANFSVQYVRIKAATLFI